MKAPNSLCVITKGLSLVLGGTRASTLLVVGIVGAAGCGEADVRGVSVNAVTASGARPVIPLGVGDYHTCTVGSTGSVVCWGFNGSGQLGDGTTTSATSGVWAQAGAVGVSNGGWHTCAALANGTARCWGYNAHGQLGDGTTTDRYSSVQAGSATNVVSVDVGYNHSCMVVANSWGDILCWGSNSNGQLGVNSTTNSTTPIIPYFTGQAIAVALGDNHTCVLITDGTVQCWGANASGQVGDGTLTERLLPVSVSGLTGVTAIAASGNSTCALISNSTIRCWGENTYGQIGNGGTTNQTTPTAVRNPANTANLTDVSAIGMGVYHSCAVAAGVAYCWGYNGSGQLGNNSTTSSTLPVAVSGVTQATKIDGGLHHTCAVLSDQTVRCWGYNLYGQLGDYSTTNRLTPVGAQSGVNTYDGPVLVVGGNHSCAWSKQWASLRCWGVNDLGQLGDGTTTERHTPVSVGLNDLVSPNGGAGAGSTCAVVSDGTVRCWGGNYRGAVGDGTTTDRLSPTSVSGLSNVVSVDVGQDFACALRSTGSVACWGYNGWGQLGDGTTTTRLSQVGVTGISSAKSLATSYNTTCVVLEDGTVRCWGAGTVGQLGNGSYNSSTTPVTVTGISNAVAITGGSYHFCALLGDHSVKCWGANPYGQLGNGTTSDSASPVDVSGISNAAVSVSGGYGITCAVMVDGTARCWGQNQSGQLGNGTTTDSTTPVTVSGLGSVAMIAADGAVWLGAATGTHVCAMKHNGEVWCWGRNGHGQLGDGSTTNRSSPVQVTGF